MVPFLEAESVTPAKFDIPVFRAPLIKSEFSAGIAFGMEHGVKLFELVDDSRFVIRPPFYGDKRKASTASRIGQQLFHELEYRYGIRSPVQFIIARNDSGKIAYYGITEKIRSVDVDDLADTERTRTVDDFQRMFETLITYCEDKVRTRSHYLMELFDATQYIYGTRPGQLEQRWYLIDTDPVFCRSLEYMNYMLGNIEENLEDSGVDFTVLEPRIKALRKTLRRRRR